MVNDNVLKQILIGWKKRQALFAAQSHSAIETELQIVDHNFNFLLSDANNTYSSFFLKHCQSFHLNLRSIANLTPYIRRLFISSARNFVFDYENSVPKSCARPNATFLLKDAAAELIMIDHALIKLASLDPLKSQIYELYFFGGLSTDEISEILILPSSVVISQWRFARAWLAREMKSRQ